MSLLVTYVFSLVLLFLTSKKSSINSICSVSFIWFSYQHKVFWAYHKTILNMVYFEHVVINRNLTTGTELGFISATEIVHSCSLLTVCMCCHRYCVVLIFRHKSSLLQEAYSVSNF